MKTLIKQVLLSFFALVICIGLVVAVVAAAMLFQGKAPSVKKGSILVFDMSVNITDGPAGFDPQQAAQDALMGQGQAPNVRLYPLVRAIEEAAKDKRIAGLFLHGSLAAHGYGSGFGALKEVRAALERFRQTGKPIHAYLVMPVVKDYYLASTANSIALNPQGTILLVNGLVAERTFYAGALQKYGIGIQTARVGKYKSYVEPYTRTNMSPENRLQTEQLLAANWDEVLQAISRDRNLGPAQCQAWVDTADALKPEDAVARKMVDKLAYFDQVLDDLRKVSGHAPAGESLPQIDIVSYCAVAKTRERDSDNTVAVVYAEGGIIDGEAGPGAVGGDTLARQLRELREDTSVKAIVLRVNSPGGSASASEAIRREVEMAKKVKPVVVSMGTVAASGGYWISSSATRIFAQPNTVTGSIGILAMLPNVKQLANEHGITWDSVKTGKYADIEGISRPKTAEEMAIVQRLLDEGYEKFLELVAAGRNKTRDAVHEIAQGRVWSGRDAEKMGLVDEFGGLGKAIAYAAQRASLGTDWSVKEFPEEKSFLQTLCEMAGGGEKPLAREGPLNRLLRETGEEVQFLRSLNDPVGLYAVMPEPIRIR